MSSNFYNKYQKRSLIKNYISLTIIITFVLFFVGIIGLILLNTKKVADYFKEQIVMTVYLEDTSKDIEITQLQKRLLLNNATKKLKKHGKNFGLKTKFLKFIINLQNLNFMF